MRILIGIMVSLALPSSQCLAISGGPNVASQISVTGSFAGVLAAKSCDGYVPPPGSVARCGANSIGIFSIVVPQSGQATGPLVIFNQGQTYVGTIKGTADPKKRTLKGLIDASFTYSTQVVSETSVKTETDGTVTDTTKFTNQSYKASAAGEMNARIKSKAQAFATAGIRLSGDANVEYALTVGSVDDEIAYQVIGFKQSDVTQ